jgi:hypothetical protein
LFETVPVTSAPHRVPLNLLIVVTLAPAILFRRVVEHWQSDL